MTGTGDAAAAGPHWADDAQSPDYRHLAAAGVAASADAFELAASDLDLLCRLNRFAPPHGDPQGDPQGGVVLFGLRGCRVVDGRGGAFAAAVTLVEATPDHVLARCVLGVWNQRDKTLAVFQGSTVPNAGAVIKQRQNPEAVGASGVANLLGCGLHSFTVGIHRPGDPLEIRGVFIEKGQVVVLRALKDVVYRIGEHWEATSPGDNIHPSRRNDETFFSSEGCQTVIGTDVAGQHGGLWAEFRARAGLAPTTEQANGPYAYVLLTGREAHLAGTLRNADQATLASFARLRFGSSGDAVKVLQAKLGIGADGSLGPGTTMAWIAHQQQRDQGAADGIVTPADAGQLGFAL
jgi:hypothetical protein